MTRQKVKRNGFFKKNNLDKPKFNIPQTITLLVLTIFFSLLMGIAIGNSNLKLKSTNDVSAFNKFIDEYNKIKDNYYEELDDELMLKKAIEHIIDSLDVNTAVIDDSFSNSLSTQLQGSFEGFGIEILNDSNNDIIIAGIVEDTPASHAGLEVMDKIKMIDNINVEGKSTTDFSKIVKDSSSSEFVLTIERDSREHKVNIKREKITLTSVTTDIYEENNKKIGYIYVSLFAYNTSQQFHDALNYLESKKIDSLIVDLRYNTGGHLTAVENMISEFLDKTHIIYQTQTKDETIEYYSKTDDKRDYEVVVLVNEQSASAAEMFAAAMQEEYNAKIIGTPTYGKGTIQEVQESLDGDFQYKLTTKKWLTPKGKWINEVGVQPDIMVELDDDSNGDKQLNAAIDELKE